MAFGIIAEALARIEHKIDLLLSNLSGPLQHPQLRFSGQVCPICKQTVEYQIDVQNSVVVRRCNCTTGKIPPATPLFPASESEPNGRARVQPTEEERSENSRGRKTR